MSGQPGAFIAVEGIDAVGKKTQTSLLMSWIRSNNLSVQSMSFPEYGTTIGREIRKFLHGEVDYPFEVRALLYAANRWERKQEIESAIAKNDAVVVNRYTGSNLAYGISNGLKLDWLVTLEEGLPRPDLVLVLDAPPVMLAPRRGVNKDTYERNLDLQQRARDAYLELASRFDWKVVDATRGIEETARAVSAAVSLTLGKKGRTV